MLTLALPALVGVLALGGEVGGWYYTQRSMQNAADAGALASATNGSGTFAAEAVSVATQYGFTNGVANTTVAATTVGCPAGTPAGTTTCYQVAISRDVPIRLARLVGFNGSVALGGGRGQTVLASAISSSRVNAGFCVIALQSSPSTANAFLINGGPIFTLGGCDVHSNASMRCNGTGPWGITASSQVGASGPGPCGTSTNLYGQSVINPFAVLSTPANIPAMPAGCPVNPTWTAGPRVIPAGGQCINGTLTITGTVNLTTTAPGGVITIYNGGNLLLSAGSRLIAPPASGLTIVFTGPAGSAVTPGFLTGTGTIDFGAPTSGTWSGVALYQDFRMIRVSARTYSGSSPAFNITGLIYAPFANVTFSGNINHQTGGLNCLGMVAYSLTTSGNGSIFANPTSQCYQAGLNLPQGPTTLNRQALVQ